MNYSSFFINTFLFKNIASDDIDKLLLGIRIHEKCYHKGDIIYSPDAFDKQIVFIYRGECQVGRPSNGGLIPLNTAKCYDSFGIITCFSDSDEFPTVVMAKTDCMALSIYADELRTLIEKCPAISFNIIEFLTRKINFLNEKIATFSGGTVEEKLASYILELNKKHGVSEFDFNKKKSAEALNCGRASLYRAIDALKDAGYITLDGKKIIINDLNGLERILK